MISTLPPIIGLSPYTRGLVTALTQHIRVDFLGFNRIYPEWLYPGKMRDDSLIPLEESPSLRIRNVLNWYNPLQWIVEAFRIKTAIIHAQWWSYPLAPVYWVILGINRLRKKRIILTVHNVIPHEKSGLKIWLNRSVFWLANEYIVHTEKNRDQLAGLVKPGKPIHVIPHGIIEPPMRGITRKDARRDLELDMNDKVLLCFGHIRDYKGVDVAIKALAQIPDKHVKLVIAGKCWEDWQKYQTLIDNLKLNDRVMTRLDFIPDDQIEVFFRAADIALLPYKYFDSQSGAGALAVSFEIPLIVSDVGGLREYAQNENYIIKADHVSSLAQKIKHFLSCPQKYYFKKSKPCHYHWSIIANRLIHNTYASHSNETLP
ncbi:MAG: glycosyltransferase family 4 protein [Candidatus Omnitrophota bacterium]